jgi:hypothetical protein
LDLAGVLPGGLQRLTAVFTRRRRVRDALRQHRLENVRMHLCEQTGNFRFNLGKRGIRMCPLPGIHGRNNILGHPRLLGVICFSILPLSISFIPPLPKILTHTPFMLLNARTVA